MGSAFWGIQFSQACRSRRDQADLLVTDGVAGVGHQGVANVSIMHRLMNCSSRFELVCVTTTEAQHIAWLVGSPGRMTVFFPSLDDRRKMHPVIGC